MKSFKSIALSIAMFLSFPNVSLGEEFVYGDSILCKNQGKKTYMALSTKEYNIAICFQGDDCVYDPEGKNLYYYVGQNKQDNSKVFLSAKYNVLDGMEWTEEWIANNNEYIYRVFHTKKQGGYSTITVLKNGDKVYNSLVRKYIYNCYD
ncbi:hypothetical protein [Crocosphaera sp. XPORK-15E]|uniref:hypothetical protein n=1 Tax=Crocosphaera sp. XPORK-15E TaxID=3110247 RepID=UPI002B1FB4FE|nr:hypothetical protein [Crocosphaera sp. XPORK-15E]MEA5533741.1 hypothetical protein [Crocosphaera sp. XPORK-15E]